MRNCSPKYEDFSHLEVARFINVDPKKEERAWMTPYNYVQNNPIVRIDPDGMLDDWYERNGQLIWKSGSETSIQFNNRTYKNVSNSDGSLKKQYRTNDGAFLAISSHRFDDVDNDQWDKQVAGIANAMKDKGSGTVIAVVETSSEFIEVLVEVTSNFGQVNGAVSRSHGGTYWGVENFREEQVYELVVKMDSREVEFGKNAIMIFNACGVGAAGGLLPTIFTESTGVPSVGGEYDTGPDGKGVFHSNGGVWYGFKLVINNLTERKAGQKSLGEKINVSDLLLNGF